MEGYTGEGEPPCIVMRLRSDFKTENPVNPDLTITLIGTEHPDTIIIKRELEQQLDHRSSSPPPPPLPPPPPPSLPPPRPQLLRRDEDKGIILYMHMSIYTLTGQISSSLCTAQPMVCVLW